MRRVCLVGAGKVAAIHAEVLAGLPDVELTGVCDSRIARAQALARRHHVEHVFASTTEAIASRAFEFAHVLVAPDRHVEVAEPFVDAGIGVLLEKPMGVSRAQCESLIARAQGHGVSLGVNHNSVFYPAYLRLRQKVVGRSCGPLQHLVVLVNHPVSWLSSPGHWKLQAPRNLAYETVVHPLSQVYDLAGPVINASAVASGRHEFGDGRHFFDTWQVSLVCEGATAQVYLSHGAYEMYRVMAICADGVLVADVEQDRLAVLDRTRWGKALRALSLREMPRHAGARARAGQPRAGRTLDAGCELKGLQLHREHEQQHRRLS